MMRKFCPRCAKETGELFSGLCEQCYLETEKIIDVPPNINVLVCRCGRSNEKKRWVSNASVDDMVERAVRAAVTSDRDTKVRVEYEPFSVSGKTRVPVRVVAEKEVGGRKILKSVTTNLTVVPQSCDVCSRVSGGYYEAVIQIRGPAYRRGDILELVKEKVRQYAATDKSSFITKVQKSKDGDDVYLGSSKVARKIGQETKRIYNVESKITHSVSGMKDGKTLKRITVLLRASD